MCICIYVCIFCLTIPFLVSFVQFNSYTQVYTPGYSQPPAGDSINPQLSVWDWDLRYSHEQILQFRNPGYDPEYCPDSWLPRQQVRCLNFLNSLEFLTGSSYLMWRSGKRQYLSPPGKASPRLFYSCHSP